MLKEERSILWRTSSTCLGLALPAVMLGNGIMYGLTVLGILTGLLATKGMSLRATVMMVRHSKLMWLLLCLLAALGVSSLLGISPDYSLHKTGQVAAMMVIALLLFAALREMPGRYTNILQRSLVVGVVSMVLLAWVDAFADSHRLSAALHGVEKALTVHRLNFHSTAIALLLPFVWAFYARRLREREPLVKMSAPIVLPISLATVFLCGGRAGMIAVVVSLIAFLALGAQRFNFNLHARHWLATLGSIAAGVGAYILSRGNLGAFWERLEVSQGDRGLGGGRWEIWQTSWNHLLDQPLTGIGPNAFRHLPENVDFHPHNALLQLALETGLIGTVLAAGGMLLLLTMFYRYAQSNVFGLAGLTALLGYLASAMFSKSIFDMEWLAILTLLLCIGWRLGWSRGQKLEGDIVHTGNFLEELKSKKSA
ncbi:MAG: O-antigen ligase family protein [Alphaproteobacteria bacterium]|nr:O-antigen ligase family protein [Alphaproteobacteria bacterium]MDD9919625.1 O-antigen ligase family protein [Alphaproteobacteria bacterium]